MKSTNQIYYSISRIIFLIGIFIIQIEFVYSQVVENQSFTKPPQVEIAGTQLLKINSSITKQDYELYVHLPRNYRDSSKSFPVIYSVDGQWDFTLITAIYGQQYYDGFMPGAIIVGITWGGENPDYDKRRAFDLTLTDAGQPDRFGNAAKFLAFIKQEAIPFIESKFRTKKDERTLTGSSFGGLFALYALFHESDIFNRYVLTSPTWMWDNSILFTYAKNFSEKKLTNPIKVFMAVGEYEDVAGFNKFANHLKELLLKDLILQTKVIEGAGHAGGKAEGFARGIQFVFTRPCLKIDANILKQYEGEYEIDSQAVVKIVVEDGQLVAFPPGNTKVNVCAETEKDFYIKGQFLNVHFVEDNGGKITGFQIQQYYSEAFAKKVK
jgi:predicted alpha/beta superfamily hydrolase